MEEGYSVIEWTIENFSCWNSEIHGNKISLPQIDFSSLPKEERFLKLFPRGASGREEYLVVKIYNPWSSGECELSYIRSDGTLIQKESMIVKREYSKVFIGPIYEKVVTRMRESEPFHKDSLTLRVRTKFRVVSFNRHAVTVLEVFKTSLKLNNTIFKDREINIGVWDRISSIQYPIDGGLEKNLYVYAKVGTREDVKLMGDQQVIVGPKTIKSREDLEVKLMFRTHGENTEKVLAQLAFSLHYNEAILKNEMNEHLFTGKDEWIIPKSMTMRELAVNTHFILLNFKIIAGNMPKTYSHWSRYPEETEISMSNTETETGERSSHQALNASETSMEVLAKEMMHLFHQDQEFSDLKIRCGEANFSVHRGILSARSPVFKSLLSSGDSATDLVDIEDLDPSTLAGFLGFLYSGSVEDLQWDRALKLYYAADKYQVPSLKRECASVLSAEISVSNVCVILSLADKHPDDQLTNATQDFILKNYNRVLKSKEWKDFMNVDPKLLLKTVTLFAENDCVGKMNESV